MGEKEFCIVTGATGSIGTEICRALLAEGKCVIATYRSEARKEQLLAAICDDIANGAEVRCLQLLLDDDASIRLFCERIKGLRIAALINNAGAMNRHYKLTAQNIEHTMAVNYFGTIALTMQLIPAISPSGCIVFTTSITRRLHRLNDNILYPSRKEFSQLGTYGRSKLVLTHFSIHLAEVLKGKIRVNCADPGVVNTDMITMHRWFDPLANLLFRPFISSPKQGAESALQALKSPLTGHIFNHKTHHPITKEITPDTSHDSLIAATLNHLNH